MNSFSVEAAIGGMITAIFLSLVVLWVARRIKFFQLPSSEYIVPVTFVETLGVFCIYIFVAVVAVPLLFLFAFHVATDIPIKYLPKSWRMWANFSSIVISFLCLVLYLALLKRKTVDSILWGPAKGKSNQLRRSFKQGFIGWFISFPFVLFVSSLTSLLAYYLWGTGEVEQLAVEQLRKLLNNPLLFTLMAVVVVTVIPFIEELLFRGFLQSFLKNYLGRDWAIGLTALLFATFHYAPGQGVGNFPLLSSLFVLSLFLGFLYEKERTLLAPLGLHMTFNAITVFFIAIAPQH